MKENKLLYLFKTFLFLGSVSFGGYMSLISMTRDRLVLRDKYIDDSKISEGLSLASLLPGPIAVNVIAYLGFCSAGFGGAMISVIAVLLPSFILVLSLSLIYFHLGNSFDFNGLLIGITPVIIAVIFTVGISMTKKVCVEKYHYLITILSASCLFFFKGYWVVIAILITAACVGVFLFKKRKPVEQLIAKRASWKGVIILSIALIIAWLSMQFLSDEFIEAKIFAMFSQISMTLFGGGYVMVPILKNLLVDQLHWLSYNEFSYGISIGQITPGPILISSVFFGYKVAGLFGSILATVAIFFPSALMMVILSKMYTAVTTNSNIQLALQAIKPAVAGMILYSAISLFLEGIQENSLVFRTILVVVSIIFIFKTKIGPVFLITGGGVLGFIFSNYI